MMRGWTLFCSVWVLSIFIRTGDSKAEDFQSYSPREFFENFQSDFFPEMDDLQPDLIPEFRGLVDFLEANGIQILIGTNSNAQTIFELYLPVISRAENLNGPIVGTDLRSAVGNLYFIMHDAAHHFVGIPGMRLKDLENPEETREKLIRVLLLKEQVATVFSLLDYIKIYWNWRDAKIHGIERREFVQHNQGAFSLGPIPREDYVDLIGDFVFGNALSYTNRIYRHYDVQQTQAARLAGVPLPILDLSRSLGVRLESHIFKWIFAPLASVVGYYGEVGHKGFMRYSEAMADFMMQEWYVRWSEDFQYGYELDDLTKRAEFYINELKHDRPLFDESVSGVFKDERLKHEIALFGRRVAELEELARRGLSRSDFDERDAAELAQAYFSALQLYRLLDEGHKTSDEIKQNFEDLIAAMNDRFPPEVYIPESSRQPFIQYQDYWRDITALAVARYGHNSNGMSPGGVRAWTMRTRQAKTKILTRLGLALEKFGLRNIRGVPSFVESLDRLSSDYEQSQVEMEIEDLRTLRSRSETQAVYLDRLQQLKRLLEFQIRKNIEPQILEQTKWNQEEKSKLFELLDRWLAGTIVQIDKLAALYDTELLSSHGNTQNFHHAEIRLNIQIDESYSLFLQLIRMAQSNRSSKLEKWTKTFEALTQSIDDEKYWETRRSLFRYFNQIAPVSSQRLHFALQLAKRWLTPANRRPNFSAEISNFPHRFFDHNRDRFDVEYVNAKVFRSHLPADDAVSIFAMNHEAGIFDAYIAQKALKRLGFNKIIILASKNASPEFKKENFKDASVVIAESEKPLDQIQSIIEEHPYQRVGVIICPEGNLASPAVHMPIAAKPGAFILARRLASRLFDRSIFYIAARLNGLEYQTQNHQTLKLEFQNAELVPNSKLERGDAWIAERRLQFENWVNQDRAAFSINLNEPRRRDGSGLYVTGPPQAYLSFGEWFGPDPLRRCIQALSYF